LAFSPVKEFAIEKEIRLFQPEKIRNNTEFLAELSKYDVDYFIVVAYGKILPNEILEIPKKMCINVHGSILPKYRGASPIQSALIS
jgi:methionyl-tRNA formyltransferase